MIDRVLRYTKARYEYEADSRQSEKCLESLSLGAG